MSLFHVNYFSQALGKQSAMYVTMPDGDGPFPVVYMLHGHSDDYTIWLRRTSIERYADVAGVMTVMLDGAKSFFVNMAHGAGNYEDHILGSVAFVDRTFHTIADAGGRAIGGLSMGGYGSMKLGLKYPDIFGSVASHSGAVDFVRRLAARAESPEFTCILKQPGDPAEDCFALAARPGPKPAIYFDCGVDDFLIQENRDLHAHLDQIGLKHVYREFPGAHTGEYWDKHIVGALAFHRRSFRALQKV